MKRADNFSAGPSALPLPVLERAAAEMTNYRGSGTSVMEISHRSPLFRSIIEDAEERLTRLLAIPESHAVLFLQGGASTQFSMVPLNLLRDGPGADFVDTGAWSQKAITEATRFGAVRIAASGKDTQYRVIPALNGNWYRPEAVYVHITANNTIYGTQFHHIPDTGKVPLVADMSSCLLSQPVDVAAYGLIYAGAQKNIGPAGLTLVIMDRQLAGKHREETPKMLQYQTHIGTKSMFNTPPTYAIYMAGLVFQWLEEMGGLAEMARRNREKAAMLYHFLDHSRHFYPLIKGRDRSLMNICFRMADPGREAGFCEAAQTAGFLNLKGHRSTGGMRASLYNAVNAQSVARLVAFMEQYEKTAI